MINLISPQAKKKLLSEYRMRLGVIILCALFLLEIFAGLVFAPTYFSLHRTETQLQAKLEGLKQNLPPNSADIEAEVASLKSEIAILRPKNSTSTPLIPSELLTSIIENKPKGISIDAIAFQSEKNTFSIQLSGVARTREDILAFKNTLGKNPHFSLAKSNDYIIKKTDITFSVVLTVK